MGILKKPKFLIIGGAALFVVIALAVFLVFLLQPKTVGFFGLSKESEEARGDEGSRPQQLGRDRGKDFRHGRQKGRGGGAASPAPPRAARRGGQYTPPRQPRSSAGQ